MEKDDGKFSITQPSMNFRWLIKKDSPYEYKVLQQQFTETFFENHMAVNTQISWREVPEFYE